MLALAASAVLAIDTDKGSDYQGACAADVCDDPAAAIHELAHGHISALWNAQPTMGPASVLLRAPFAALAQLGDDSVTNEYRWGAFICCSSRRCSSSGRVVRRWRAAPLRSSWCRSRSGH